MGKTISSEVKISLNTGQTGQVSFKTDNMMGKLCSMIIESQSKISIIVESEYGYLIFRRNEMFGNNYIAVRARTYAPEDNIRDIPQFDEFLLNEAMIITLMGPKNQEVGITIRLD